MSDISSYVKCMPANVLKIDKENAYYHIHNKGREDRVIFNDINDFDTFIAYLNEYLTSPADPLTTKKMFTVQGKTYHGIPHQPKNYYKKIELISYSLVNNGFNLLIKQNQKGSIKLFIRSLCTRYSMYFNKKYQKSGSLFEGSYKSIYLEDVSDLTLLSYYFHKMGVKSSINKYLRNNPPEWALKQKNIITYKDFIDKYALTTEQKGRLSEIVMDLNPLPDSSTKIEPKQTKQDNLYQNKPKYVYIHQRIPEILFSSFVFILLLIFAVRNISINAKKNNNNADLKNTLGSGFTVDHGQVAGIAIESLDEKYGNSTKTNSPVKLFALIKSNTKEAIVSIYDDTKKSKELFMAADGEKFELVAKNDDWAEIKIPTQDNGFVESIYIEVLESI